MSISALLVLKLAVHLAGKRKPVAAGKVVVMPGGFICADKQIPSITVQAYPLHKELSLICKKLYITLLFESHPIKIAYENPIPFRPDIVGPVCRCTIKD